jgi:3-oxoacyl-[acyl-carrier protein] reductase
VAGKLDGKVAIVTGSGQGIGKGIAICLARNGAKVITNNRKPGGAGNYNKADIPDEEWQEVARLQGDAQTTADFITSEGGEAEAFFGDVADFAAAGELIRFALDRYGRLDILVNNAAGVSAGALLTINESDWRYQLDTKLDGMFNCCKHAAPIMIEQNFGRILNCSSDAWVGMPNACAYSAGNGGVVSFTKAIAKELYRFGITVNAYCPQGNSPSHVVEFNETIRTLKKVMGDKFSASPELLAEAERNHGPAENTAPFLAYLATDEAAFVSGSVFAVTAAGKIDLYSDPQPIKRIQHDGQPWTMDELIEQMPQTLFEGYSTPAQVNFYGG